MKLMNTPDAGVVTTTRYAYLRDGNDVVRTTLKAYKMLGYEAFMNYSDYYCNLEKEMQI